MQILFETAWLAPGQFQAASQLRLNGEQLVDEAEFFRAAQKTFFPRGNVSVEFSFVVHWSFPSIVAAEVFFLTFLNQLPMTNADAGPLQCVCGADTPATAQTVYMQNCVLEKVRMVEIVGTSIDVEYTIVGSGFSSSVPSNVPSYPNQNEVVQVFRRGQIALTPGATSQAVTFSSSLPGMPGADPYCWISGPTGSTMFDCWCMHDSVTTAGFTAGFGAAVPGSGYYLNFAVFM